MDVPWVADKVRYLPEERRSFLERCVVELKTRGRSYVMIHGDWEHRFQLAVEAVNELLQSR